MRRNRHQAGVCLLRGPPPLKSSSHVDIVPAGVVCCPCRGDSGGGCRWECPSCSCAASGLAMPGCSS